MTKIQKTYLQNLATVLRKKKQSNIFRLPPFHLKQERKLMYALLQNNMRHFDRFVGNFRFFYSFMTGNLIPNYGGVLKL